MQFVDTPTNTKFKFYLKMSYNALFNSVLLKKVKKIMFKKITDLRNLWTLPFPEISKNHLFSINKLGFTDK
jgi:hypothetical protein